MCSIMERAQRGVSLVELIVVLAVLAITASIALPSYQAFIQNTQIRTVGESIVNGLQVARAEAIKRNEGVSFEMLEGSAWQVCLETDLECDDPVQSRETGEGASAAITVTFQPVASTTIVFSALGTIKNGPPPTSITIQGPNEGTRTLQVKVGTSGSAKLCDPSAGKKDPRSCA